MTARGPPGLVRAPVAAMLTDMAGKYSAHHDRAHPRRHCFLD